LTLGNSKERYSWQALSFAYCRYQS